MTTPQLTHPAISELALKSYAAAREVVSCLAIDGSDPLPAAYASAMTRFTAARTIAETPVISEFGPAYKWPTKPAEIAAAISKEATRRAGANLAQTVAAEVCEMAATGALTALRDWARSSLANLDNQYRATADAYLNAARQAPSRLHGRNEPEEVAAYIARADAAETLDVIATRRRALGNALLESNCSPDSIWLLGAWPTEADDERRELLYRVSHQYADRRAWEARDAVDRWHDLLALLDPSLAPFMGASDRADRWQAGMQQAPATAQMTMLGQRDYLATLPPRIAAQFAARLATDQVQAA